MGVFADMVKRSRPIKKNFSLGFQFGSEKENEDVEYLLTLAKKEKGAEPIVQEQKLSGCNSEIILKQEADKRILSEFQDLLGISGVVASENGGNKQFRIGLSEPFISMAAFGWLTGGLSYIEEKQEDLSNELKELKGSLEAIWKALGIRNRRYFEYLEVDCYSFAPIRAKPERTYDPLKVDASPDGSEVPTALMTLSQTDKKRWEAFREELIEFGRSSGLFTDVKVRKFGKSMSDPFQLEFRVKGPRVNVLDVGYGISQLLPILVRLFDAKPKTTFLMQQPEVHLHPKAQAELSSLLASLVKQREHRFLIETHSDAMINRARIEIMKKKIAPEDVSLIYLEPAGNSVKVHNIKFDEQANLLDVPSGYRDFFLNESKKLLGFSND